ncbi:hypothetical protein HLB35_00175 [Halomonas sp. TBZ9]|uniref:Uncharacterized protein n=1 Tax=Vreelandella azerica TaxID=2732867 RepID=A0A7Y3TW83_9GAMM|nr:hypothetical protein [Halomonas azerica]NOG30577.1 hypothetical protein [Halomonas azerica]
MADLVAEAADYKPRKARQQVVNYLDRSVLQSIESNLLPAVDDLDHLIASESKNAIRRRKEALLKLQQELSEKVIDWAEELKDRGDRALLATRINTLITDRLTIELRHSVESFLENVDTILVQVEENDIGSFEDIEIEYSKVSGRAKQAAASAGGAVAGAAAGSVFGPVGTVVGGALGGLLGGAGGQYLVETEIVKEKVGVDATQAIEETLKKLDQKLPSFVKRTFEPWDEALNEMKRSSRKIRSEIQIFEQSLNDAKEYI